ncbi:putative aryl-alcohol dehydrogenase [Moniliophthora roreri]|nr:putative aryl-alcohol dehydrogenase [Moniliophthora roreri]
MNEYEEPPVTVGSDTPRALSSDCRGEFELMSPSFTSCKVHFRTSYTVRVIGRVIRRLRVRQSRGAESQRIHVHARAILQKLVAAMSYNRITRQPPVSAFTPAPPPPTELGVYRTLFSRAGVYVSPLCLDAMSIGGKWNNFIGSIGLRDQIFIATKYKALYKRANPSAMQKVQFMGNNTKNSIKCSVEDSSKKLRTTYIYLFYVHRWDWDTSIEEVMDGLHDLVVQGKVLYLGISDTLAWVVVKAKQYAKDHEKTPFVVYQGTALALWSVLAG